MTEIDTPVSIELTDEEIEALRDGEIEEIDLHVDGDRRDFLEIAWKTEIESEGAESFHDDLTSLFE